MSKPNVILKDYLIMPVTATKNRIEEIKNELTLQPSRVVLNGLFITLLSYEESTQKEIIKYYLKYYPNKIPGFDKAKPKYIKVHRATLSDNENFDLLEHIVADCVDMMPFWKLSDLFYKLLNLRKPANYSVTQEIRKRRNELIHNNLKVNYKYKTIGQDFVEREYLEKSILEFENYLTNIENQINSKFSKYSKINALQELWYYTFKTPLCSDFNDYWYVDYEKDSIQGIKTPKQEGCLSSGEKFMLDIWRSQVSGAKVDFLNMASVGSHFQNCLYLFLKLSNDIFMYGN